MPEEFSLPGELNAFLESGELAPNLDKLLIEAFEARTLTPVDLMNALVERERLTQQERILLLNQAAIWESEEISHYSELLDQILRPKEDPVDLAEPQWDIGWTPRPTVDKSAYHWNNDAPFANPDRLPIMLDGLDQLTANRQIDTTFSMESGLVQTLRGNLAVTAPTLTEAKFKDASDTFLRTNANALTGADYRPQELQLPEAVGATVRTRQMINGIPVYGGVISVGFQSEDMNSSGAQLSFVNSSWYPIDAEEVDVDFTDVGEIVPSIAVTHVIEVLKSQHKLEDESVLRARLEAFPVDAYGAEGKVVLPLFETAARRRFASRALRSNLADQRPAYWPAYFYYVVDEDTGRFWVVAIDGKNLTVLVANEGTRHAPIPVQRDILPTPRHALKPPTFVSHTLTETASGELTDAVDFPFVVSPNTPACTAPDFGTTAQKRRSANIYYHLSVAHTACQMMIDDAWPELDPAMRPLAPPAAGATLPVHMCDNPGSAAYSASRKFYFGRGDPTGAPRFRDPSFDPEVIYHEYAHALLHVIQPDLLASLALTPFDRVIDEGIAFYLACALSEGSDDLGVPPAFQEPLRQSKWGKVAYDFPEWGDFRDLEHTRKQRDGYDFLQLYRLFPSYPGGVSDPGNSEVYACSMVWARTLWDIRRTLGAKWTNAAIVRGISLAGGVQSELETPAEAIIHADGALARAHGVRDHESALRLIFSSRGIVADAPIHALRSILLGGRRLLLAATEGNAPSGAQPGCMISEDDGDTWRPLGVAGPSDAVAIAVLVENTKATIWVAGQEWAGQPPNESALNTIYCYELTLNGGDLDLNAAWSVVAQMPNQLGVLSMAVLGRVDQPPLLFVGSERGLYRLGAGYQPELLPQLIGNNRRIYDLSLAQAPGLPTRLLAATERGAWVLDVTSGQNPTFDPAFDANRPQQRCLSITAMPSVDASNHAAWRIWAGVFGEGLYTFDYAGNQPQGAWRPLGLTFDVNGNPILPRAVYALIAAEDQGLHVTIGANGGLFDHTAGVGAQASAVGLDSTDRASFTGATITTICKHNSDLVIGTAERGVWRKRNNQPWTRQANGLSRIGRMTDSLAVPLTGQISPLLPVTHVFHVAQAMQRIDLTVAVPAAGVLKLFFTPAKIDPAAGELAGLQEIGSWQVQTGMPTTTLSVAGAVLAGFYLLTLQDVSSAGAYTVTVQLVP